MLNRSISIAPPMSFFEPCPISTLIHAPISGACNLYHNEFSTSKYIKSNESVLRGWKQSVIILIGFPCAPNYYAKWLRLPLLLFRHLTEFGPQKAFLNHIVVPDPVQILGINADPTHNIHYRTYDMCGDMVTW
jgi:hypothetical protein